MARKLPEDIYICLHQLWGKAVGTPTYVKKDWLWFASALEAFAADTTAWKDRRKGGRRWDDKGVTQ